jgi:hypothetical protein
MAIGSDGEIGKVFGTWGKLTPEQQREWFAFMRESWGDNLMAGYATLQHPPRGDDNRYTERLES